MPSLVFLPSRVASCESPAELLRIGRGMGFKECHDRVERFRVVVDLINQFIEAFFEGFVLRLPLKGCHCCSPPRRWRPAPTTSSAGTAQLDPLPRARLPRRWDAPVRR